MESTLKHHNLDHYAEEMEYPEDFPILWQFPKEFKRNWFTQLDARFLIILVATFLVHVTLIFLLLSWIKVLDKNVDINSIQKQYAHLLLNKSKEVDHFVDDSMTMGTYLYGIPEESQPEHSTQKINEVANRTGDVNSYQNYAENSQQDALNVDGISSGDRGRTDTDKTLNSYGTGTEQSIGSVGLLSYLSENNNSSNEELREIFAQGDRNTQYLEGSLANVNMTNFKGQGSTSGSASRNVTYSGGLKGSKSNVSTGDLVSSMKPLEKVDYSTIAKNTELEEFSASVLNKIGSKAAARKAEQVTKVILAHNRAIQDCYKQALKKHPELRGKVVVRFSVTPEGLVDLVEVINSTIDHEQMLNCIVNRIRRWNDFGESDLSLGTVSYRQTYVFGY